MDCESAREAISATIDGEAPGLPDAALETHLETCAACRDWQQRAHALTRRARLGGAFLDHDLAASVLDAVPAARPARRRQLAQRGLLLAAALAQLAVAAPLLLGHDREAGVHAAHELGSFNLALAVAFVAGAVRPRLSAGLAWPCVIAAAGLVITAVADLISGQAVGADEAEHLVALGGALLLTWQARTPPVTSAGSAVLDSSREEPRPALREVSAERDRRPPQPPGGHAARLGVPDLAAETARQPDESVA